MKLDVLNFVQKLLSKCIPVKVNYIKEIKLESFNFEESSDFSSMINFHLYECLKQYSKKCKNSSITNIITPFNTQYYALCLSKEKDKHLLIGPFLENPLPDNLIFSIINNLKLNLNHTNKFKSYYQSLPYIDASTLFEILSTINEYIKETPLSPKVDTLDLSVLPKENSSYELFVENINRSSMYKTIENRYADEEKLLSYITKGDVMLAQSFFEKYDLKCLEIIRINDSIRNTKNLLLSTNTLFRRASYLGGVHPIYLDELSAKWAIKIEKALSFEVLNDIPLQMIRSYCILTKEHSLSKYSPIVKLTLEFINLNLSSNLTVKKIASEIGLSPDYLTRLFKKELGTNIITFINKKRIYTSLKLLKTTDLSISEIGDLIGLNNTSYFYTLFKKEIGMSPNQYRKSLESE